MYFHRTPFWLRVAYPGLVWVRRSSGKEIFLTFDDGPVPQATEYILDLLEEFSVKATFFCVGENIIRYPHLFERILTEGHRVGNHTYNHLNGWKTDLNQYLNNVKQCQDLINQFVKTENPLFRPPYGKIKRVQARALKDLYTIIMWDVLSGDFDKRLNPQQCLENSVKSTRSGSIIIFHDSLKAERNVKHALPLYLKAMKDKGFTFLTL